MVKKTFRINHICLRQTCLNFFQNKKFRLFTIQGFCEMKNWQKWAVSHHHFWLKIKCCYQNAKIWGLYMLIKYEDYNVPLQLHLLKHFSVEQAVKMYIFSDFWTFLIVICNCLQLVFCLINQNDEIWRLLCAIVIIPFETCFS